uniref:Uncharacterized protein n=1 Tax=Meloidogyne enterolobii TaxID=390850 RepID=A0A6V7VF05_MELEN|nr:unnamed protein product [Meloidogyne enterolobii]
MGVLIKEQNNLICMCFVELKNKWFAIEYNCCYNKCINTNNHIGKCKKGFVNLINDENIEYLIKEGDYKESGFVYAEIPFKKPQNSFIYSLYYFEVKCKWEKESSCYERYMSIGLKNCTTKNTTRYIAKYSSIYNERNDSFKLSTFSWNDNDTFGCGLVYPPTNKVNEEFPYIFFTQNGKTIGIGITSSKNSDIYYRPYVELRCCSIKANFGNDLETNPFKFEISKNLTVKEVY